MTWKAGCLAELADFVQWTPPSWLAQASCRNPKYRPSWWFMDDSTKISTRLKERAKNICALECPVRWKCLARYLDEPFGIYGGLDPVERHVLYTSVRIRNRENPEFLRMKVEKSLEIKEGMVKVKVKVS